MTLKAGKGTRGGGVGWGHRVGAGPTCFSPPPPQPKILYETLIRHSHAFCTWLLLMLTHPLPKLDKTAVDEIAVDEPGPH